MITIEYERKLKEMRGWREKIRNFEAKIDGKLRNFQKIFRLD